MKPVGRLQIWRAAATAGGLSLLALALFGCRTDRSVWRAKLSDQRVRRMVGIWSADLHLDRVADTASRSAVGVVSVTLNEQRASAPGFDEPPMLFGTYDVAFDSLRRAGYDVGPASGIPALVGQVRGDSVELVFAPDSKASVSLVGVVRGDSIVGRWSTEFRRAGVQGRGDFVLRRR